MKKKILWISARSIQDTTTQDTICAKAMLKALTFYEDIDIACASTFAFLDANALKTILTNNIQDQDKITIVHDETRIQYFYKKCSTNLYKDLTQKDYMGLNLLIGDLYRKFKPDLIIGYGQDDFFIGANFVEAKLRGVPTVYFLPNIQHHDVAFSLSDVIFSPYASVCDYYQKQNNIKVECCEPIFDKESVLIDKDQHNKSYIVFIDNNDDKAIDDFLSLVIKAYENKLDQNFLFIMQPKDYTVYFEKYNKKHNTNYSLNNLSNLNRTIRNCEIRKIVAVSKMYLALNSQSVEEIELCLSFLVNDVPCIAIEQDEFKDCSDEGFIILNRNDDNYLEQIYEHILTLNAKINLQQNISFKKCHNFINSFDLTNSASKILTIIDPLLKKYASLNSQYYRHGSFFR